MEKTMNILYLPFTFVILPHLQWGRRQVISLQNVAHYVV